MSDQTQYPTPTEHTHNLYQRAQANGDEQMQSHLVETFGPDAFRPKSPFDAIKTVEDAIDYLSLPFFSIEITGVVDDEYNKSTKYYQALFVARALNRIANGGEEWEWEADGEEEAFVCFNSENGIQCAGYKYPDLAGCQFKTREAAQYFIDNFSSLITALK